MSACRPAHQFATVGRRVRALWARFARGERLGAEDPLEFLALRG
ncbi:MULTISPECIES: hypothetical protein [Microbacterium]|nr:hypothetical protein [Microbacterium lacticum]